MPTIAAAATKGGTGKSSLIANLAVCAAQDSAVAIIDYDPQHSLTRWHELRGSPENPIAFEGTKKGPHADVPALATGADWVFLDLPPAIQHIIRDGVKHADLVLIPIKASPLDLDAIGAVVELCQQHKRPFRFVLSMYDPKWKLSETAFTYLERVVPGHTLKEVFGYRQAYVGAMIDGCTGAEFDGDPKQARAARTEIDALWASVQRAAK